MSLPEDRRKDTFLAAKAVETQGKGSVLPTLAFVANTLLVAAQLLVAATATVTAQKRPLGVVPHDGPTVSRA